MKDEIEDLIGVRPSSWTILGSDDDVTIPVWFEHTPSKDRPEGQPLTWDNLQTLDEKYGVISVQSDSDGRTGSKLCVTLNDGY